MYVYYVTNIQITIVSALLTLLFVFCTLRTVVKANIPICVGVQRHSQGSICHNHQLAEAHVWLWCV